MANKPEIDNTRDNNERLEELANRIETAGVSATKLLAQAASVAVGMAGSTHPLVRLLQDSQVEMFILTELMRHFIEKLAGINPVAADHRRTYRIVSLHEDCHHVLHTRELHRFYAENVPRAAVEYLRYVGPWGMEYEGGLCRVQVLRDTKWDDVGFVHRPSLPPQRKKDKTSNEID